MRRQFSAAQRRLLAFAAAGRSQSCGIPLTPSFHADHRRPFSAGGPTITANGQALCEACNLLKGNKMIRLRPWQAEAHDKAVDWFLDKATDRHFLIDAAPGAGKTLVSCAIAETMIKRGFVQRVVVIAPRTEVFNQWAKDFSYVTGRHMSRITGADDDFSAMKLDVCATWAATDALHDGLDVKSSIATAIV
ncbi:DEAD/DEAH box helicase family protein [Hephaestia mangrovi]|uniref:DEAD/DEAH box helicase family protein n=1 Tax=Hephaestia mangrovi TaxID=2873268 RepID=UPI001CA71262|nr:DEAD/DEAH box helicase family protein [Hephaestia mangrovi]MBY8827294.1 DEAD/DEAH box helicase family protein [Hephaestia mangrovi]